MQWAEGGRSVLSSPFIFQFLIQHFTSLDDFIDARLGRRPANIHLHPYSAPNSARVSSTASTTASVPPDSPSLASQSLMSDESAPITPTQETNKHGPHLTASASDAPQSFSAQDPLSRSARIRAFRAFQHASPDPKLIGVSFMHAISSLQKLIFSLRSMSLLLMVSVLQRIS